MKRRCPRSQFVGKANLKDYALQFRGGGFATIEPQAGAIVEGAIWNITRSCLKELDMYEGFPRFYGKEQITVTLPDGETLEALVYIMQPGYDLQLPSKLYFMTVAQGYVDCQLNIDSLYKAFSGTLQGMDSNHDRFTHQTIKHLNQTAHRLKCSR